MFRKSSLLIAALALVLAVPVAHAAGGWTIGVNGGMSKATGDAGKDQKMGPVAGIDICMHVNDRIAVGVEGNWISNKHKDVGVAVNQGDLDLDGTDDFSTLNEDKFTILSGGVHGKYMFPVSEESKVAPYGLIGVGAYNAKENFKETLTLSTDPSNPFVFTDESLGVKGSTRLGGKVGAGAVYKATEQVGITLQAEYNIVTLDTKGAPSGTPSTFKFYGVRAGVNFHIMPK
jgi:opacity protein-like surface antigen